MAKVITVMNMKGGVGKSTVAMHLGGMYARYKDAHKRDRRVLLIDYDPQFNLSQAFLPAKTYFALEKARRTSLAILQDDETDLDPYVLQVPGNHAPPSVKTLAHGLSKQHTLDLVPSTLDLMYVALGHSTSSVRPIEERFNKFIAEARTLYDVVIIDCHPAGSLLTKTSLRNSDHVVIPVVPQSFAVRGIGLMLEFISAASAGGKSAAPHILFNMTHRTSMSKEELQIRSNASFKGHCLTHTLKEYKVFAEPYEGQNFVWTSGKPWSTLAFRNLDDVITELWDRITVSTNP